MSLGFWQLDRANQKEALIADHRALVTNRPILIDSVKGLKLDDYQPLELVGFFVPRVFLLDNQVFNGKVGYEVVQPFKLLNDNIVFVSRGFIQGNLDRRILPEVKTPLFQVKIAGYSYQPKLNSLIDEDVTKLSDAWPVRVQSLLVENLYNHWAKSDRIAAPFLESSLVRLEAESAYNFKAHWMLVNNTPEKHIGYAVQWFAMAGLLLVLFAWSIISNKDEELSDS